MPGADSLIKRQYYGHKYNVFWKIIFELFQGQFTENYTNRVEFALKNKLAIWDSLQFCERKGSLDAAIKNEIPNTFTLFFNQYPKIKTLAFNGQKAFAYFKKYNALSPNFTYLQLPSTSPANAATKYPQKLEKWAQIVSFV